MTDATTLMVSSLCNALIIGVPSFHESQISRQAGESDIFQRYVRGLRQGVRYRAGDILRRDHFVARPISFDMIPDVSVRRRRINVDDANLAVALFFAHRLCTPFGGGFARAVGVSVGNAG